MVDAADGERPVAREDRALKGHVVAHLPSERLDEPLANHRGRSLPQERLLLIFGNLNLRIHLQVTLRIDGELREELSAIAVLTAKPVRPGHGLDVRDR